jgi:hypothetical protein
MNLVRRYYGVLHSPQTSRHARLSALAKLIDLQKACRAFQIGSFPFEHNPRPIPFDETRPSLLSFWKPTDSPHFGSVDSLPIEVQQILKQTHRNGGASYFDYIKAHCRGIVRGKTVESIVKLPEPAPTRSVDVMIQNTLITIWGTAEERSRLVVVRMNDAFTQKIRTALELAMLIVHETRHIQTFHAAAGKPIPGKKQNEMESLREEKMFLVNYAARLPAESPARAEAKAALDRCLKQIQALGQSTDSPEPRLQNLERFRF